MINLVFDLDNTLYFRDEAFFQATQEIFPEIPNAKYIQLFEDFQHFSAVYFDHHQCQLIDFQTMRQLRIKATLRPHIQTISDNQANTWQQAYERHQYAIKRSPIITEILDWCQSQSIQLGIITNGNSNHQLTKIRNLNLTLWIQEHRILVSDDVGIAKPHPKIFGHMAKKLPRNTTYYIGDDYEKDIQGAHNFGWRTIWFHNPESISNPVYDHQVSNHYDLLNLLKTLIK